MAKIAVVGCGVQNGLGSPEIAAPILGADRLAVGVVGGFGASIRAPGHAHHNGMEMIRFGAFAGLPKQLLQASAKIWESAGFKVALFDDIKQMVWDKLRWHRNHWGILALAASNHW